jgi:hypothetical protein
MDRSARLSAKLKDMLTTRALLEEAIKKFKLYSRTVDNKGMLDAVDEMKPHVGFRARQGGTYVIAFDSAEIENGKTQDLVRDVTQYLAEELIEAYSNSSLTDLKTSVNFFEQQLKASEDDVERATKAVTVFLSKHPEFAMSAQQGGNQFGIAAASTLTKTPKLPGVVDRPQPKLDPALLALYQADPTLRVLYLQRAKVEEDLKASLQQAAPGPAPTSSAATAALQEQIALATADVDAAQKRVADTQADVMSKSSKLAPEHPDMKSAVVAAAAAGAQLQQAKAKLAQLQAQRAASAGGANPYEIAGANPELVAKLKDLNAQIGQREAELKKGAGTTPAPAPSTSSDVGASATASAPPVPVEPVSPLVALETEWQRLLRDLAGAKQTLELRKKDYEKANMSVRAAQAASNEMMAVMEPAYKPSHPFKGGRTPVAMGGAAIAMLLALLYMAARVVFNDTIIDAADVEALQLIPVLGVVPKIDVPPAPKDKAKDKSAGAAPRGGAAGVA